ncbi:MAG: hypothetical protein JWQ39_1711 [Glaciihabitans sp.]|nr:hypothetical protein [Glaciihabitans sp.]
MPWVIAAIVAGIWLLVVLFQLGDVVTVFLDSRTARDREIPSRIARERTNELFWIIPIVALLALMIGVGVDHAGRYFFDARNFSDAMNPAIGSLIVLGIAILVVGVAGLALGATAATDPVSYSALRRDLRDHEGERITRQQLADFRTRLARIDARTRSRMRPTRLLLTTPSVLRLATIVVGFFVVASVWIAVAFAPSDQSASLIAVSILAPVLSALFAALGIRFAVSSDLAWRRVYAKQRVDILKLLENFERSSRKGVAGLGDRVARALKILSEQQPPA